MSFSTITALSPLDGRYASKLNHLRPLMSEQGYMQRRVQVEIAWFIALSDVNFAEFKPLSPGARTYLLGLVKNFSEADAVAIKEIEKTTNHDVKAVEYWIKSKFEARPELARASEFVHFACTSEDINNLSHALMLKEAMKEQVGGRCMGREGGRQAGRRAAGVQTERVAQFSPTLSQLHAGAAHHGQAHC